MKVAIPGITVGVFGAVRLITESGFQYVTSPVLRTLLAYLAIEHPRTVATDVLIARTWVENVPKDPVATLQLTVWKLRRWLRQNAGTGVDVVKSGHGYALVLTHGSTDLAEFRRLVREAEPLPGDQAYERLARALTLSDGPPLADVPENRRDLLVIAGLENEWRAIVRRCAQLALGVDPESSVSLVRPLCQKDPLDEEAHAILVEALATTGNQAQALAEIDAIRVRLASQLGIGPGTRLCQVRDWILRRTATGPDAPPAVCTHEETSRRYEERLSALTAEVASLKAWVAAFAPQVERQRKVD